MWLGLAVAFGGLGLLAWRLLGASSSSSGAPPATEPAHSADDAELGTLPQVPGLLDREAKEPGFCRELLTVVRELDADGDRLAALMSEESGFHPEAKNPNGGATGLMQWLPSTAPLVGTTVEALAKMSAIEQVRGPVRATLKLWGKAGRKDPAMAGWGSHVGEPDDTVIARKDVDGNRFLWNKVYDANKDDAITVGEVRRAVYNRLGPAAAKPRIGADGKPVAATAVANA